MFLITLTLITNGGGALFNPKKGGGGGGHAAIQVVLHGSMPHRQ